MTKYFKKHREPIVSGLLWIIVFATYIATLSRSVGFIDSGELAAVCSTLGIAHPTGYPLFTMLGRVFSLIPFSGEEVIRLNIMSALFTSSAAVVYYYILLHFFEPMGNKRTTLHMMASSCATLVLAFSQTFWRQGITVEVYSLHLLLIGATLLSFLKAIGTDENTWWIFFAFILGLSFTNHLTTILLAPAFLYLFFTEIGLNRPAFVRIAKLSIPFSVGLSVYVFLPVRAAIQPLLNWGNPQSGNTFLNHVTGKQFRVWMFDSVDTAKKQFAYFVERVPLEFFYISFIIALVGVFVLFFSNKRIFTFVSLLLIACIGYSINYDIHDIDSYFLLAYIAISVFCGFGIKKIFQGITRKESPILMVAVTVLLVGLQMFGNWSAVDQRKNYYVEDYTKSILYHLPQKSIILSFQWDYFISASYYYQHVKKIRPDIRILDKELFRRSWYFPQLEKIYPDLMERSKKESEIFLRELHKFEHDLPYDYAAIEGSYEQLLKSFIGKNIDDVPIFVTHEIEEQYTAGYYRIPYGFVYRLVKDPTVYVESPVPSIKIRSEVAADQYVNQLRNISSRAVWRRAEYEQFHQKNDIALRYFNLSRNLSKY